MAYIDQFGVPEDVNNALGMSPPFIQSRDEAVSKLAQQRATKWRQRASGLAAGLQAGLRGNGFGESFLGGLSGALQGGEQFAAQEDERQFIRNRQAMADQMAQREADQRAIGLDQAQQRIGIDQQQLTETTRHNMANEGVPDRSLSELDYFLKDPAGYKRFKDTGRAPQTGEDSPIIDDQTLNDYADALATSGAFPNLGGFGKYGTKVKMMIGQRASQRHPGLNIAKVAANYKSDQAALSKLTQASAGLEAFSETARRNTDILLETSNSIPEYGNRAMNSGARKLAALMGDENIARFNTALETVVPEFARILQSGGQIGGQQLTDAQKKDMRHVLSGDFTKGQLVASVNILKREIENRKLAQDASMKHLQDKITPGTGQPAADSDPLGILGGP